MNSVETVYVPHLSSYRIYAGLFTDVQNAAFLRQQLLAGNTDFEYAFLDATMILCRDHILAACFRALNDMDNDRLKSRNVHSEVVFSLSPNNNIAESFRRFGVTDSTKHVLAVKIGMECSASADSIARHLQENIQGLPEAFSDDSFAAIRDLSRIRKIYKCHATTTRSDQLPGNPSDVAAMTSFILGTMALKGS